MDIKKDFPYSLVKTGDMAIKTKSLNNGNAVYSHSEVLSTNEQTNRKIFDYIGAVWKKLEPDCNTMSEYQRIPDRRVSNSAKDNSVYAKDYEYSGKEPSVVDTSYMDNLSSDSDVDESFWDEALKEENNKGSSEDSFWDNWNS